MNSQIKATNEIVCTVTDWGTETNGGPRKITRTIFKTNTEGFYEIFTGRSSHGGLYAHNNRSEIVSVNELKKRYTYQLNGINIQEGKHGKTIAKR